MSVVSGRGGVGIGDVYLEEGVSVEVCSRTPCPVPRLLVGPGVFGVAFDGLTSCVSILTKF